MNFSSYPRPGQSIAPKLLRDILDVSLPADWQVASLRTLADLDESSWARLGPDIPHLLARDVVTVIRQSIPALPASVQTRRLPRLPADTPPDRLELERRTFNYLAWTGLLSKPAVLSQLTIGEVLKIKGFGAKCLVDLLTSMESLAGGERVAQAEELSDGPSQARSLRVEDERTADDVTAWLHEHGLLDSPTVEDESTVDEETLLLEAFDTEWSEVVTGEDPRFRDLLGSDPSSLADRIDWALEPDRPPMEIRKLATLVRHVRERVVKLEALPLDKALSHLVDATRFSRKSALMARLGWHGGPPQTLESAGRLAGVTRERIRQMEYAFQKRLPTRVFLPQVENALRLLEASSPIDVYDAGLQLVAHGISSIPLDPRGVLRAAVLAGYPTGLVVEPSATGEVLVAESIGPTLREFRRILGKVARPFHVFHREVVEERLTEEGLNLGADLERHLKLTGACHLDGDWWWYLQPGGEDPLGSLITSILAVAGQLDIASLRDAIHRRMQFRRKQSAKLPRSALTALLRQRDEYIVEGEIVRNRAMHNYRDLLGPTDRTLVDVILESPGHVLDRGALQSACRERGMNLNTFSLYTSYSPYVLRLGGGLWCIRGVPPDPVRVEELRTRIAGRRRRILDHRWTDSGRLQLVVQLKDAALAVIGIPIAVRSYLAGRSFEVPGEAGRPFATIRVDESGSSWGYTPFFNRMGAEAGDLLVIEFDIAKNRAYLQLAEKDALEED